MKSPNSMQWEKFDEVIYCKNSEIFAKGFFQHGFYGSVYNPVSAFFSKGD